MTFQKKLEKLINQECLENESNTPDFILAEYMCRCLDAFKSATLRREKWYDVTLEPGMDCGKRMRGEK